MFFNKQPKVDRLIRKFSRIAEELRNEANRQDELAARASARISELAEEREAAFAECARADRIALKLEELVS